MIADASMRHHVDYPAAYEDLVKKKTVGEASAGRKADEFVLKVAKKKECKFLSNDMFNDYKEEFGHDWVYENRLTCKYFAGDFFIS